MYYRKIEDKRRLKKLHVKTCHSYGSGAYYDKKKYRYIRYKDCGNHYTYLKRLSNKKIRRYNKDLSNGNGYRKVFDVMWNWI